MQRLTFLFTGGYTTPKYNMIWHGGTLILKLQAVLPVLFSTLGRHSVLQEQKHYANESLPCEEYICCWKTFWLPPWGLIEYSDNAVLGWFTNTQRWKIQFCSRFRALCKKKQKKRGAWIKESSWLRVWLSGHILFIILLCFDQLTVGLNM